MTLKPVGRHEHRCQGYSGLNYQNTVKHKYSRPTELKAIIIISMTLQNFHPLNTQKYSTLKMLCGL